MTGPHLVARGGAPGTERQDGPAELLARVRAAEDADPDGARWPRSKLRDDATVLYWPQPG